MIKSVSPLLADNSTTKIMLNIPSTLYFIVLTTDN